jgi:hypothetical protein
MTHTTKPSPAKVRNWMHQRQVERTPPPSPEQVKRELGWGLIEAERAAKQLG